MHKKLEAELVSLAHSILESENKNDIAELHKKAQEIYEKLTVLKFVDSFLDTPQITDEKTKEVIEKTEIKVEAISKPVEEKEVIVEKKEVISEEKVEEIFETKVNFSKNDKDELPSLQKSLEDEFKDAISADVATNLFEKVTKENPVIDTNQDIKKRSLNDTLFTNNIQVGLNDRIAFVKQLFDGSQEDFNRVLSQLNSFKTEEEAKSFIYDIVKPDYNWDDKEEYEMRLINLIERKFL